MNNKAMTKSSAASKNKAIDTINAGIEKRNLRSDELEKWFDFLCYELFPNDLRKIIEDIWYADAEKDINGVFVAVDSHENIISSAKVNCRKMNFRGSAVLTGVFSGVGTKKEYRNRGISKQLFAMCYRYMKDKGASIAHLYSNPDTVDFYRHLGYLGLPQQPGESFYRMYFVVSPFKYGNVQIEDTKALIDILGSGK